MRNYNTRILLGDFLIRLESLDEGRDRLTISTPWVTIIENPSVGETGEFLMRRLATLINCSSDLDNNVKRLLDEWEKLDTTGEVLQGQKEKKEENNA